MIATPRPEEPRRPPVYLLLAVLLALCAAACGELTPPEAYSPTTSSTTPATPDGEGEVVEESATGTGQVTPEFITSADPGYVPLLLVAGNRPVFAFDGLESTPLSGPLVGLVAVAVFDDLGGGVVYQQSDGAVIYRPSQGESVELLEPGAGALLGVGDWDAAPRAFVKSAPGRIDWIQLVTERAGRFEQRTHFELAEGEEIVDFSASRDIQAVVVQDENCGEIRFYNSDGQRLSIPSPAAPACTFPGRPSFGTVALSPDAGAVAYTVVTWRDDGTEQVTELAAQDIVTRADAFIPRRVGEELDTISSLTYDGSRVAFIRSSDGVESVILLDLVDRVELGVDQLQATDIDSVAFTRGPLDLGP